MNQNDFFKRLNIDIDDDDNKEDELFDDINNAQDDINNDYLDDDLIDSDSDGDSVDASSIGLKKGHLNKKTILLGIGGASLVLIIIVDIISLIVIHNDKPPVALNVHIQSNNKSDKSIAKYGDMITLSFTFDKEIKNTPTVIINGKDVEAFGSGREFKANYFVIDQGYKEIDVAFSIENYKDSFGKSGDKVYNTTDLSKVTIAALNV